MIKRNMKRRNLLMTVAILLAIGCVAAYFTAKFVLKERTQGWREHGIAASKAGDHEKAADLLGRYLRRIPSDTVALRYYITSRERAELPNGQHLAETIGALKLLLREVPDSLDDRRHLLELYAKIDRRPEAIDTANEILKKYPADSRTLELKTDVLTRLGQFRDALDCADKWAAASPLSVGPHLTRLTLRHRLGQSSAEILADAQELREAHPNDPRFELIQGAAYAEVGDRQQAEKWLMAAAKRTTPKDDFAEPLLAQFERVALNTQSLALLQEWVKAGSSAAIRYRLARRLWEVGRWEDTVNVLADVNLADPSTDATLIAMKAMALANLKKKPEAEASLAALAGRKQPVAQAWAAVVRSMLNGTSVDDKQLVIDCESALYQDPQNSYLRYFLGDACLRMGETDLAIEAWRRAAAQNLTWSTPPVRLAEVLITRGHVRDALEVAALAVRRNPNNVAAAIGFARAWAANLGAPRVGSADDLLKLVAEIQQQVPGEERTLLIQLQLLAQQGHKDQAIELARKAIARKPQPNEYLFVNLANLSSRFGLGLEAECFTQCEKAHGATSSLAYAVALNQAMSNRAADGLKRFDDMAKRSGKGSEVAWQLARARYLDLIGDGGAKAAWVTLANANPGNLSVQQAAVSALAVRGDREFLQGVIDRLKWLTGEKSLGWRLAQARLLVQSPRNEADYVEGSKLLNTLVQSYPQLPEARVLLAEALVRMSRVDGAIDQLAVATQLDPNSVSSAFQLAALLQSQGENDRARAELDRITPLLQSAEQRKQAALLLAQQGAPDQAIKLMEESQKETGAGRPDLFLAVLYGKRGELKKAEAVVQQLLEKPDLATVQFAVMLFAFQGRTADAEKALARLDSIKLQPGMKEIAWGNYYQAIKKLPEAAKSYKQATRTGPANAAAWQSLAMCEMRMGDVTAALATVTESLESIPDNKAMALIKSQSSLLRAAAADSDLRPLVISLLRDPVNGGVTVELLKTVVEGRQAGDMERLAAQLQRLVDAYPNYLPARSQLAQCDWAMGRYTDAQTALQRAMAAFSTDPEPARLSAMLAATTERWSDAIKAAQAWKQRAPDNAAPDLAMANAYIGAGQSDAAMRLLQPYLKAGTADPDKHVDVLTLQCRTLAASGRVDAASELLWPLAAKFAQWRQVWVQVATSLPQPQAVVWLDRIAAIIPAKSLEERAMLAQALDTVGRRPAGDPKLIQRATAEFDRLAADSNASAPILLVAGIHADTSGRAAVAESLYRRALAKDANLVPAMNNLAFLIATHGGDMKEAVGLARSAAKLNPGQATVHDTLALVLSKAGDFAAAAESMRAAIRLDPDNAKWRVRLAQYLLDAGQLAEAGKAIGDLDGRRLDVQKLSPELRDQLDTIRKRLRPETAAAARFQ